MGVSRGKDRAPPFGSPGPKSRILLWQRLSYRVTEEGRACLLIQKLLQKCMQPVRANLPYPPGLSQVPGDWGWGSVLEEEPPALGLDGRGAQRRTGSGTLHSVLTLDTQ